MSLTDAKIRNLKPKTNRYCEWDGGIAGFGVRVTPKGIKSFILAYRVNGKSRLLTIGTYPALPLVEARVKAAQARDDLAHNIDPGKKQVDAKKAHRDSPTVGDLVTEYLEKWAIRKKSGKEDTRILKREVMPAWGDRKAKEITRRDIITVLDAIVERGSPIQANRTLAVIRKMFNFAVGRDIVPASPCVAIPAPAKENRRDRVLSEEEISVLWKGLDSAKMSPHSKLALQLQLVTAQRKGEIISAAWNEIDLPGKVWTIPAEKSKNAMPHRVPLSTLALELLKQLQPISSGSEWLFPSPHNLAVHMAPTAVDHALRKNIVANNIPIENVTPHDLRRTAASHITSIGIARLVVSKVLNHAESGVTAVYDRHSYDNEKRQALNLWSLKLEEIIFGKKQTNVVPMVKKGSNAG